MARNILLVLLTISFGTSQFAQIISYGENEVNDDDTVKIVSQAPQFKVKGYENFEAYLEQKLFEHPLSRTQAISAIGANALIQFTVDKTGTVKNTNVDCSIIDLTLPLQEVVDNMPYWSPGIKNDRKVNTRMEFYFNITRVEAGSFVVIPERMPPALDKTTLPLKIGIMVAAVVGIIYAWVRL